MSARYQMRRRDRDVETLADGLGWRATCHGAGCTSIGLKRS
jgi:hypothetical protein